MCEREKVCERKYVCKKEKGKKVLFFFFFSFLKIISRNHNRVQGYNWIMSSDYERVCLSPLRLSAMVSSHPLKNQPGTTGECGEERDRMNQRIMMGESTCFNALLSQDDWTTVGRGAPLRRAPAAWVQTRKLYGAIVWLRGIFLATRHNMSIQYERTLL